MSIHDVARLRAEARAQAEALNSTKAALDASPIGLLLAEQQQRLAEIKGALKEAEDQFREFVLSNYKGVKKGDGWGVRMMKRVQYDEGQATAWCRENLPGALSLNKKVFEKLAPYIDSAPITTYEEMAATIASDLSRWED